MAVSGRTAADFRGSVSRGSAEDFEHCCEPCLTEDQHIEAFRYCVDCREYLCKNCVRYHQKTKVLKQHQLIENDKAGKHIPIAGSSETYTEKCSTHMNEVIKFYCPEHETLGCTDCMTMEHRTCNLDYIPDKCKDVGNSQEYKETIEALYGKLKDIDNLMKRAAARDKEINSFYDKIIQEIIQFRKEINDHLDTLQKKIEADINQKKSLVKQKVKTVAQTCTSVSKRIVQLQSSLQDKQSANQNIHLFIALKRTKRKLLSDEINEAEKALDMTNVQHVFERNADVENILSMQDFGRLKIQNTLASNIRSTMLSYKSGSDVNLGTDTDTSTCSIFGCAILSHKKVVVVDNANNKVKIVDVERKVVTDDMKLGSCPWDVTRLENDQIAVTLPIQKEILIMTTSGRLRTSRTINVNDLCYGIVYHKGSLFVLCLDPNSVMTLDLHGNVKNSFTLTEEQIGNPCYMAFNPDNNLLYICDWQGSSVVCLSLQGEVLAVLEDSELGIPRGVLVLDDGSLLVCCNVSDAIYSVTGNLQQKRKIGDSLNSLPCSLCYNETRSEICIGYARCDQLKIFNF